MTIVETPHDDAQTDTDADKTIDTDGTVFTTLDQWIDSGQIATDGGSRQ